MKRSKTNSFILELRLKTTKPNEEELQHRFFLGNKAYNICVKEARRRLGRYFADKDVKSVLGKRKVNPKYKYTKADKAVLSAAQERHELSEYSFQTYLQKQNKPMKNYLDANTIQKLATRCWQAATQVLFRNGETVHFRKFEDMDSLEGKTNKSGIMFRDNCLRWNGLEIPVVVRHRDTWAQMALTHRVKYCRIVRRWHKNHYSFYLQLVLEGDTPPKVDKEGNFKHKAKEETVGLDIGPSTVAAWSPNGIVFQEFADDVEKVDKEIARLNRKLDRQRRANNPQNYTEDGQIKRLKKGEKRIWNYSKGYIQTRNKLRTLRHKRAAKVKMSHNNLANNIIDTLGNKIYIEKMNWKALQKKAKKQKNEAPKQELQTGQVVSMETPKKKNKRRKRFGKSILCHSPAQFTSILKLKAKASGGEVIEIDPADVKASQYNHITNSYKPVKLKERWKQLDEKNKVQRDMYSAFCLGNLNTSNHHINRRKCNQNYKTFKPQHDAVIAKLRKDKKNGKQFPACMGI